MAFVSVLLSLVAQKHALAAPFDYFTGNWECTSDAASKSFMLYHPVLGSQWLVLENTFINPPSTIGEFIEYYRYDQQDRKWWATSMGSNGLLEVSTSGDWKMISSSLKVQRISRADRSNHARFTHAGKTALLSVSTTNKRSSAG